MKKKVKATQKITKTYTRAVSFWRKRGSLVYRFKAKKTVNCGKKQKLIMRNDIFSLCQFYFY